jgi:hypothetical protein
VLDRGDLPDWAVAVGRSTLLIIDETGMADSPSIEVPVSGWSVMINNLPRSARLSSLLCKQGC